MSVAWIDGRKGPSDSPGKVTSDGLPEHYSIGGSPGRGSETVLFCLIDDAYRPLNPGGSDAYGSLERLSDSEVLRLALFQQLGGLESERSFLRDAERFF
jgi:hypothetical protein